MIKVILIVVLIFGITTGILGDLRYRGNAVHPDYPGQCYYEELNQPIPKSQSFRPINREDHCMSIYCRPDYVLEMEYCGRHNMVPTDTCFIDSDMRYAFPKCCPKLVCQDTEDDNQI